MKEFYDIETKNNKQNPPTNFIKRRRLFYIEVDNLATQDSKDLILKPLFGRSDQKKCTLVRDDKYFSGIHSPLDKVNE